MNTKVLVTGANGQLGKTIKQLYASNKDEIQFIFATKLELDISIKNEVEAFFDKDKFDYCINCAAFTNVEKAETNPEIAFKINAEAVKNLAQVCKINKTVLIHISTDYVFDGEKNIPYVEEDKTNPINEYGKSKLLGEKYIQEILQKHFIIRTSGLYSKYSVNFMKTMINLSKQKDELSIVYNQIGTPTYTKDLAEVIFEFIYNKHQEYGTYHFSNEGFTNWYNLAKAIFEFSDIKIKLYPIKAEAYPTLAKRPKYSVLDKSKIIKNLNVNIPFWKESLKKAILNL